MKPIVSGVESTYLLKLGYLLVSLATAGTVAGGRAYAGPPVPVGTSGKQPAQSGGSGVEQVKQKAKAHTRAAEIHYNLGHYEQAIQEYSRAYRLFPAPALLFNLGQCHRALGQHEQAITLYGNYLRAEPGAANRKLVEQLIAESRATLAQGQANAAAAVHPALRFDRDVADAGDGADGERPFYRSWWFWGVIGGAAVATAGGMYLVTQQGPALPASSLGVLDLR